MAHQLELINDQAAMFFVGETPWHGLGTRLNHAPSIEEGLEAAKLNWTVGRRDLHLADGRSVSHKAIVRESDNSILGVVGPSYRPLQNAEAFEWFRPLLDAGLAELHTAGSLFNGKKVWCLAKLCRPAMEIQPGDVVDKFIMLSNSHDGHRAVRVGFTPVRVVCNNTLSLAHRSDESQLIRVLHSQRVVQNLESLRELINVVDARFEATADQYRALARRDINQADLKRYVCLVLEMNPDRLSTIEENRITKVMELATAGKGNSGSTWWDAYNGVTEYLSYAAGRIQDRRLDSVWFGTGAHTNVRALSTALELSHAVAA